MNKKMLEFPISVYGNAEKVNDILTKQRCRIFYTNANRNGTYITPTFAEELISTLHYVPIKGIFDGEDYTDHGVRRSEGRIYGIVPENNNFAWESHLDEDGVERTYACTDVYLYTSLYPEATIIAGKSLSMELYEPSLSYHFEVHGGQKYVVFDHGSFLGLQVLGDNVEPCFEGASFYTLQKSIEDAVQKIREFSSLGDSNMDKMNFKLSDDQKFNLIWELINTNYNEENNWTIDYSICAIYDDYALVVKYADNTHERIYYTKDDATDSIVLGERVKVYLVDVTEQEKTTLDTLQALNGGNYDLVSETLTNAEATAANYAESVETINSLNTKIEELDNQISTLTTEMETSQSNFNALKDQYEETISNLNEENSALNAYKKDIETQQKESIVSEYSNQLADNILEEYREKFEELSAEELDMHLAYELKKLGSFMNKPDNSSGYIPKDNNYTGVEGILQKYRK